MRKSGQKTEPAPLQNDHDASLPRSEHAYRYLRTAIRAGRLKPGDRLREADLAAAIGLSRTPIREALARLESERLIVNDSSRGLVVTELDYSSINELYFMREVLEGTAARLAAQHASEVEISILEDMCAQYGAAIGDDDESLSTKNRQFHDMLCQCAHNRYLVNTINMLHESLSLLGNSTLGQLERAQQTRTEHEAVLQAIRDRDPALAEQTMRNHIRTSQKFRMKLIFARRQ